VEVTHLESLDRVAEQLHAEDPEAAAKLNDAIAERFRDYSMVLRSVLYSVVGQ